MGKDKLAIIDADGLIFAIGWQFKDRLNIAGEIAFKAKLDNFITDILVKVEAKYYLGFYGEDGTKNFRHRVAVSRPYKGNRVSQPWSQFFKAVAKKHFAEKWKFHGMSHIESDDACVIAHHKFKDKYDIVHISEDKDALQMGDFVRYNPKTKRFEEYDYDTGRNAFFCQMVTGDAVDNIPGIPGKGEKCREVLEIKTLKSEVDRYNFVRDLYFEKFEIDYFNYFVEQYILLAMLTVPKFDYPTEERIMPVVIPKTTIIKPDINIINI